jgi:ABC-type transport system substrate-binding protein
MDRKGSPGTIGSPRRGRSLARGTWLCALAAAGALVLAACGSSGSASTGGQQSSGAAKQGGTLTFGDVAFPTTMDPTLNYIRSETQGPMMEAVYGLLGYSDPKTGAVTLSFLQSMSGSSDNKTWTLVLHKGLKFSDGTPLDAAAIAFNIKRGADPNSGDGFQADLAQMATTVVNSTTLKITLLSPNSEFEASLMQEMPFMASPTAVKSEGSGFATHPVGAGPFKVQSWIQNATLTLVPNNYYASFAPGEPHLSTLIFQDLEAGGQTQLFSALDSGSAQMAYLLGSRQVNQARKAGMTVQVNVSGGGEWLAFNTSKPPFNDVRAREAVSLALNHADLASAWSSGGIPAMTNMFSTSSPYYSPQFNVVTQNSAKARQLFSQLQAEGHPVTFTVTVTTGTSAAGDYVQSALSQYPGVSVKVNAELNSKYLSDQVSGNFQLIQAGTSYSNPIPTLMDYVEPNGPTNFGKWNDPKVGAAITKILSTSDQTVQKAQWEIIQQEIATQYPLFTSQESQLSLGYRTNVGGVDLVEFGTIPLFEKVFIK